MEFPINEIIYVSFSVLFLLVSTFLILMIDDLLDKRKRRVIEDVLTKLQGSVKSIHGMIDEEDDFSVRLAAFILKELGLSKITKADIVDSSAVIAQRIDEISEKVKTMIKDE